MKLEQEFSQGDTDVANEGTSISSVNTNPFLDDDKNPITNDDDSKNPFKETSSTNPFDDDEGKEKYFFSYTVRVTCGWAFFRETAVENAFRKHWSENGREIIFK